VQARSGGLGMAPAAPMLAPSAIALADRRLMALAGFGRIGARQPGCAAWPSSRRRSTSYARSFTTGCPWFLGPETWPAWLGEEPTDARQLKAMLAPYPSEEMTCWPVSTRVGNVKNNDPSLRADFSALNLRRWLAAGCWSS